MATHTHTYGNFSEFLQATGKPLPEGFVNPASNFRTTDWSGNVNFKQAIDIAQTGWAEGRRRISDLSATLTKRIARKETRPIVNYDVSGDMFDIGRVVSGMPESFMVWEQSEVEAHGSKIVKIVVSLAISSGVSSDTIINRGAIVCALIDCLELVGFRCEVSVTMDSQTSKVTNHTQIKVKDASEPLQMDKLAFILCHPAMLRRLIFRHAEVCLPQAEAQAFASGAYGRLLPASLEGDITFNMMHYDNRAWHTIEEMEAEVIAQLETQGVTLSD